MEERCTDVLCAYIGVLFLWAGNGTKLDGLNPVPAPADWRGIEE
jgi:hypothetical protein